MPKEKKERTGRIGVPLVGETYQKMLLSKEFEEGIARRERTREEKVQTREKGKKAKEYKKELPPKKEGTMAERPPFKKR